MMRPVSAKQTDTTGAILTLLATGRAFQAGFRLGRLNPLSGI